MQVAGFDSLGLGTTSLGDSVSRNVSTSEKWVNFETDFDEEEMMQNDDAGVGGPIDESNEPMDDFQKIMKQLQQLQTQPLFTQEEEEEVKADDDLFDDDEDYEDIHALNQKQKQNDQESKKKVFDDEDDDYYDDYSDEEFDGKKSEKKPSSGSPSDSTNVMQDFMKGKTATHRFKSRFDDFADDGEELLSSGSRKLRKNDSIKVISTPNGKVGIVYKVEPKSPEEDKTKKSSESQSGGTLEVHQKITPVMTADGKVALLYRGASDNSETFRNKYEPITNKDILTQLIDNNNKSTTSSSSSNVLNSIKNITTKNSIYNSNYDSYDSFNRNSNNVIIDPAAIESDSVESSVNNRQLTNGDPESHESTSSRGTDLQSTFTTTATMNTISTTTTTASLSRPEDDVLNPSPDENDQLYQERQENTLQINRPLSEVLGIKKNLYLDASVKIPNIETSTHKMRITNSNNLLSSLLGSINGNDNSTGSNRIVSNYVSKNFRNNANIEYEDRLSIGDRRGYSVNGYSQSRFSINRRTTPPLPPRIIKEESEEEWSNDNSVPEVINLAIIPAFEHEIEEKYLRPHGDDHYYRRHKHHYNNVAPGHPTVHCAMQVIVACVVLGTFFGIAGAFFRSRIIDQIRILYW